jgi:putative ABC transport system ATP-binding protein
MIQIRKLEFSYPGSGFRLKVPELEIGHGQSVALVGRSGCGKTTLASLVAGILTPDSGSVEVAGRSISSLDDAARRAFRIAEIGFVFQDFALLDYLPARENLLLPYSVNRSLKATPDDIKRAETIANSVGLSDKLDRYPSQLSGGERQRLAVARALVTQPALVIADEPTGNLDAETAGEVIAELLTRAGDATVLAVTHDESLLKQFDRVIDVGPYSA